MAVATACSSCAKQILASPEGGLPPWCPHCGANIKADSNASSWPVATASAPLGRTGMMPTLDAAPTESFFHACVPAFFENDHRLYRIYVTATDLLFFSIGVGPVSMGELLPRTRSVMSPRPGLAGAVAMLQETQQLHLAKRMQELDSANEATLRQFAVSGDRAFVVAPDDLKWMTLSGPSLWNRWVCNVEHEAVWKFAHRTQGKWSLVLPALRDARRAAEWLPRLFKDRVQVSLSWGTSAQKS
jgi:hypothetical protein